VAEGQPTISTHVLDTGSGRPAAGVVVTLYRTDTEDGKPGRMTQTMTDGDGRVGDLLGRPLQPGDYRLEFTIDRERWTFFSRVTVDFRVEDTSRSYHVPLLLAPFGATTYRGS
jgi:5-hydroxyisourate hydrolase